MNIDVLQTTTNIVASLRAILSAYRQHERDLQYYDSETSDMLHALEFVEYTDEEGNQFSRRLTVNRQKRRIAKNQLEQLQEAYDYIMKNPGLLNALGPIPAKIGRIKHTQNNRTYTPRTDTVLKQAFDKAKKQANNH